MQIVLITLKSPQCFIKKGTMKTKNSSVSRVRNAGCGCGGCFLRVLKKKILIPELVYRTADPEPQPCQKWLLDGATDFL